MHEAALLTRAMSRPLCCGVVVGVLGVDPSRLQLSAAPAYKAEPHAGADAAKLVRVGGLEPPISCARGTRFRQAKLYPDWRPVGVTIPSHRVDSAAASPNASRAVVCTGRLERPLDALSTRSLCRLEYVHVDQAGLREGFRRRLKRPLPLPLGSLV